MLKLFIKINKYADNKIDKHEPGCQQYHRQGVDFPLS